MINDERLNSMTKSDKKVIKYHFSVTSDLVGEYSIEKWGNDIRKILIDPRGWTKYGYSFEECACTTPKQCNGLRITLCREKNIVKICQFDGFSCYDPETHDIYVHYGNWMGRDHPENKSLSSMPIDRYRTYIINHEVGHSLGLEHDTNCAGPGQPASVMQQMTRGSAHVAPCIENEWPTSAIGGKNDWEMSRAIIMLIIILIFIQIIFALSCFERLQSPLVKPKPIVVDYTKDRPIFSFL